MLAKGMYLSLDVEIADQYIKRVIPDAKYMKKSKGYTLAFIRDEKGEYLIRKEHYTMIGTNNYDELISLYDGYKQMTIFDYL